MFHILNIQVYILYSGEEILVADKWAEPSSEIALWRSWVALGLKNSSDSWHMEVSDIKLNLFSLIRKDQDLKHL